MDTTWGLLLLEIQICNEFINQTRKPKKQHREYKSSTPGGHIIVTAQPEVSYDPFREVLEPRILARHQREHSLPQWLSFHVLSGRTDLRASKVTPVTSFVNMYHAKLLLPILGNWTCFLIMCFMSCFMVNFEVIIVHYAKLCVKAEEPVPWSGLLSNPQ